MIKVYYNFLDYINYVHEHILNLNYYSCKEYHDHIEGPHTWPGKRSLCFSKSYPMLYLYVRSNLKKIIQDIDDYNYVTILSAYRSAKDNDEDWIHKDQGETVLIYTGTTNLNSGTSFYSENSNDEILSCKYVRNTALYFVGDIRHKASNSFGNKKENSRYTINCFLKK